MKEILAVTNHVVDITDVEDSSTVRTSCTLTSCVIEAYDIVKIIGNILHIHRACETEIELKNHSPDRAELWDANTRCFEKGSRTYFVILILDVLIRWNKLAFLISIIYVWLICVILVYDFISDVRNRSTFLAKRSEYSRTWNFKFQLSVSYLTNFPNISSRCSGVSDQKENISKYKEIQMREGMVSTEKLFEEIEGTRSVIQSWRAESGTRAR